MGGSHVQRVNGEDGDFLLEIRRAGVEPSGGSILGFPIWLVTRLRWQLSSPKQWAVEVIPPGAVGLTRGRRRVEQVLFDTEEDALAGVRRIADELTRGRYRHDQ